jgi:LacI family transcriptional regulator
VYHHFAGTVTSVVLHEQVEYYLHRQVQYYLHRQVQYYCLTQFIIKVKIMVIDVLEYAGNGMKAKGTTKIKEIAEHLGISPGTVSVVLNGRGDEMRISKATQKRVKEAARELNYQPNIYARRLRNAQAGEACKVIAVFWSTEFTDDIMGRFFMGMYNTANERGHNVEFFIQLYDLDRLSERKEIMSSSRFSGIIIGGATDCDIEFLKANTFDLPVVLLNRNEERYHCVYINDYEIGRSVANLFYLRNRKKVALISIKRKVYGVMLRHVGFLESCVKANIDVRQDWIVETDERDYATGYKAAQKLLQGEEKPDAIFVMSPGQMLGTVMACKDAGIKIPEDIEILTYGDSKMFQYFSPTISSVYIPIETLAEHALNLLISVIENGIDVPMSHMLKAEYAFRESCGGFPEETLNEITNEN